MKELHHFYWGIVAMILAWVLLWTTSTSAWVLAVLMAFGVWMVVDDMYQHWYQRQRVPRKERPFYLIPNTDYRSPVHLLYQFLFGWLHKRIVKWYRGLGDEHFKRK